MVAEWNARLGVWYCCGIRDGVQPKQLYNDGWRFHSIAHPPADTPATDGAR